MILYIRTVRDSEEGRSPSPPDPAGKIPASAHRFDGPMLEP